MKLPHKKKILGSSWAIKFQEYPLDERMLPCNGYIFPATKTINIKASLSKDAMLKAYVEMIFRALAYESGIDLDAERFAKSFLSLFKMIPK